MNNKLKISCLAALSMMSIACIANAETAPEKHIAIKNSTSNMCIAFSATAINRDGNKLEFGTTEGQYIWPGVYFLTGAEYDEVYLSNLKFYKVSDPTTCANAELVAEYNFTDTPDMCKIKPGSINGGIIGARNTMQTIDIHYDLIWTGDNQGNTFAEGILSCDNAHASIYYSSDIPDNIITE